MLQPQASNMKWYNITAYLIVRSTINFSVPESHSSIACLLKWNICLEYGLRLYTACRGCLDHVPFYVHWWRRKRREIPQHMISDTADWHGLGRWNCYFNAFTSQAARQCKPCVNGVHYSNGRFCDFLLFSQGHAWESDPSTDRHAKWLKRRRFGQGCAFWSKNRNVLYQLTPNPEKHQNLANFSLDFALALEVSPGKTHKSCLEPAKYHSQ